MHIQKNIKNKIIGRKLLIDGKNATFDDNRAISNMDGKLIKGIRDKKIITSAVKVLKNKVVSNSKEWQKVKEREKEKNPLWKYQTEVVAYEEMYAVFEMEKVFRDVTATTPLKKIISGFLFMTSNYGGGGSRKRAPRSRKISRLSDR